jgi:hypothetical protein
LKGRGKSREERNKEKEIRNTRRAKFSTSGQLSATIKLAISNKITLLHATLNHKSKKPLRRVAFMSIYSTWLNHVNN